MRNAEHDRIVARYRRGDGFVDLWLHVYDEDQTNESPGVSGDYCQAKTVLEARTMAARYQREWKARKLIFEKKI